MTKPTVKLAQPRLYNVKETAVFFSMSRRWVYERIKAGDLDGYLCGNMLVSGASINRYLATRAVGPAAFPTNVQPAEHEPVAGAA